MMVLLEEDKINANEPEWTMIQLSYIGEKVADPDDLILAAEKIDPMIELYVPAISYTEGDVTVQQNFMDGYIFVRNIAPEQLNRLMRHEYFLLCLKEAKQPATVTDTYLNELKEDYLRRYKLKFKTGVNVRITKGFWEGFEGIVVATHDTQINIQVRTESITKIMDIPMFFVELLDRNANEYGFEDGLLDLEEERMILENLDSIDEEGDDE